MATRRRTTIRWDRLGRAGLGAMIGVILLLYVSPTKHWIEQSRTSGEQKTELRDLTRENQRLKRQVKRLDSPGALEREARDLGMVRAGERGYVIQNLPRTKR
jgi:cell division protein FtsB